MGGDGRGGTRQHGRALSLRNAARRRERVTAEQLSGLLRFKEHLARIDNSGRSSLNAPDRVVVHVLDQARRRTPFASSSPRVSPSCEQDRVIDLDRRGGFGL